MWLCLLSQKQRHTSVGHWLVRQLCQKDLQTPGVPVVLHRVLEDQLGQGFQLGHRPVQVVQVDQVDQRRKCHPPVVQQVLGYQQHQQDQVAPVVLSSHQKGIAHHWVPP